MRIVASVLFVLLIVLQLQLWFGSHGVFQLWSLENTIDQSKKDNDALLLRNEQLHAEVVELKKGEEALEERALVASWGLLRMEKFFIGLSQKLKIKTLTDQ